VDDDDDDDDGESGEKGRARGKGGQEWTDGQGDSLNDNREEREISVRNLYFIILPFGDNNVDRIRFGLCHR
ncbi:unnamed protein product, partial [Acanthocheilonema viteae]